MGRLTAQPCFYLATLTLALAACVQGQEPAKRAKPTKWPELKRADERRVGGMIRRLVHQNEKKREDALNGLLEIGVTSSKYLLRAINDRQPELHEPVFGILDRVTTADYSEVIADLLTGDKRVAVRHWAARRLTDLAVPASKKPLQKALKDKDERVRYLAALGLCSLGDWQGFDLVFERCKTNFAEESSRIHDVLASSRGKPAANLVQARMDRADVASVLTGLRLMRTLAPPEYAGVLKVFLDNKAHAVKKEAINALRVVVDGDAPVENLSVFQVIGAAKKWKERL